MSSVHGSFWEIGRFGPHALEHWSNQTNNFKMYACRFLARPLALLGYGKEWLAQFEDNVTEWDIGSLYWCPGHPVGQHYKVAMSADCYKSVPILI